MPRTRKDCLLCGKKNLCKLSNHLADIHHLSSEERRIYLSDAKSFFTDKEDYSIMHRSKRARMDNYDEEASSSSQNGDIFDSDDEKEKEHSSEEESNSEENENSEKEDSKEESEDGEHETSEEGEDYDPWQTLIHEAKLQLLDKFQENVECLNYEGLG
jgi:Mg-chelatase subunit ChlI